MLGDYQLSIKSTRLTAVLLPHHWHGISISNGARFFFLQRVRRVAGGDDGAGRAEGRGPGPRVQRFRGHRLVLPGLRRQRHRGRHDGEAPRGGRPRLRLQQLRALGPRALGTLPDLRTRQVPGQSPRSPFTHPHTYHHRIRRMRVPTSPRK
jgi:hypothetical protein